MLLKLFGVQHSTGIYQDKPYDNYNLYVLDPQSKRDNVHGLVPMMFRRNNRQVPYLVVKAAVFNSICAPDLIDKIIGKQINVDFDAYGNAAKIEIQQ